MLQYCTHIFATILFMYLKQGLHLYHDMFNNLGLLIPVKFHEVLLSIMYYKKNKGNRIQSCRVLHFTELNLVCSWYRIVMYLGQEMYDLLPCT